MRSLIPNMLVAVGCAFGWLTVFGPTANVLAQETKAATTGGAQLPKPDPEFKGKVGETLKDSTASYPQPLKAPK